MAHIRYRSVETNRSVTIHSRLATLIAAKVAVHDVERESVTIFFGLFAFSPQSLLLLFPCWVLWNLQNS